MLNKLSNDEILEFIETTFEGKTGKPFGDAKIKEIIQLGEKRYEAKIPPGYKDSNKDSIEDATKKYGDLLVWLQTLEYAKENSCSVVFITDDKKEDWWLEQSGRTISPRPELIEEFIKETGQSFWMYSVSKFIEETASINKKEVNPVVMDEIRKISERLEKITRETNEFVFQSKKSTTPSIRVSQEVSFCDEYENSGIIVITLERPMKYATGSGKFRPLLSDIPYFQVELIENPENSNEEVHIDISYGCGTNKDFNVYLKARKGELTAGDYVFQYRAFVGDDLEEETEIQEE